MNNRFKFSTDWQYDLLKYTIMDKHGFKALNLYDDTYFTLIEHQLIAFALKKYYKSKRKLPRNKNVFNEFLSNVIKSQRFNEDLTKSDIDHINVLVDDLFTGYVKDGDEILDDCRKFVSYIDMKDLVESMDINDFNQYDGFVKKASKIISNRDINKKDKGQFLVRDIKERQFHRQDRGSILPTPFRQVNKSTNAGGYSKGSIIVILDKPKRSKTAALVNVARGYLRLRKKVFIVDLENGMDEYFSRVEQSISNKSKKDILSGNYDKDVQKIIRKYKRLNTELYIKRFPAYSDMNDVEAELEYIYREFGIKFDVIIFDFMALMASLTKAQDDVKRISDVYLEASNLAHKFDIDHIWTAHHITRPAEARMATRYQENDIAKCIDIIRHTQAIWGLNRSVDEDEQGILRWELVTQRDGVPSAKALFQVNQETQRMMEFTQAQRDEYDKIIQESENEEKEYVGDL
jgi:hypothetical protein